ncbi:Thiol-disulfide oxidoreductase ResA [Thalassocella blandensis]|nr:Thiol-disulfide oxidoreductase ResA [Thalassocella blandensis]
MYSFLRSSSFALIFSMLFTAGAFASPDIGKPAPEFTLKNTDGKEVNLADFKGKTVVLEWTNHQCPFVKKHYESGNMQKLQKEATGEGIVWLSIISSAPGKQGFVSSDEAKDLTKSRKAVPSQVLFDPSGKVGKAYSAKTTPHMYIIDDKGTLQYMGGIDSIPSANQDDIGKATNYVTQAIKELKAGKTISQPKTRPYGCSVKYDA